MTPVPAIAAVSPPTVPREALQPLMVRTDGPAIRRLCGHADRGDHRPRLGLTLAGNAEGGLSTIEEKAAAAGIAVVYVDFRVDANKNSEDSIRILGQIFGADAKTGNHVSYNSGSGALSYDGTAFATLNMGLDATAVKNAVFMV